VFWFGPEEGVMKKTDIGVCVFMYAVCILFGVMNAQLDPAVQIYPWFIIILLAALTTGYLISIVVKGKKVGVASGMGELFKGFLPKQFFPVLGMIVGYVVLIALIGFYIPTVIFMVGVLLWLHVKPIPMCITIVSLLAIIIVTFEVLLKVKMPTGILFG
jgi:putative tricarboxylic transport membrane protein